MSKAGDFDYTESSGNVFADLGIADPESALAKAELARQIGQIIAERQLSHPQAAKLLGIDPHELSDLTQGRLGTLSIDHLLRLLLSLGRDIEIHIKPRVGPDGQVSVVAVA